MTFDEAYSYRLTPKSGKCLISGLVSRDKLIEVLHTHNLSYRYITETNKSGKLELFNDVIDIVMDVVLYARKI